MKLDVILSDNKRTSMFTSLTYSPSSPSLLAASDLSQILSFSSTGESETIPLSSKDEKNKKQSSSSSTPTANSTNLDDSTLPFHITDLTTFPPQGTNPTNLLAVTCSDGSLRFLKSSPPYTQDKHIKNAHEGSAICLAFNHDGSTIVSGGEDGRIKTWSRNGNLRSVIGQSEMPVYCLCWCFDFSDSSSSGGGGGGFGESILFGKGSGVVSLKTSGSNNNTDNDNNAPSSNSSSKNLSFQVCPQGAGIVTCLDTSPVHSLILTGSEDCKYRVYTRHGLLLYESSKNEHVITSVKWRPGGMEFAVGGFNVIRMCDKAGWTHCRFRGGAEPLLLVDVNNGGGESKNDDDFAASVVKDVVASTSVSFGSVMKMKWSPDGTQLACACASGCVVLANLVDRREEWGGVSVRLIEGRKIIIEDVGSNSSNDKFNNVEELEFPRDRVIDFKIGFSKLVVVTTTQCYIYDGPDFTSSPVVFDLKSSASFNVNLVVMGPKHFVLVDNVSGITVYSYDGRTISNPKFQGLRPSYLSADLISLSSDVLAVLDQTDLRTIRLFDTLTGRPLASCGEVKHTQEVKSLGLSLYSSSSLDRKLTFVDSNRELFLTPTANLTGIQRKHACLKVCTMVDSFKWNSASDLLCCVTDGRLVTYYYVHALHVSKDLMPKSTITSDASDFGKNCHILTFDSTTLTIRRQDGATLTTAVSPYPAMLYDFTSSNRFKDAVRLCRYVKVPELWAALAGMSINAMDLESAEISLAQIKSVDKLQYVKYIRNIESSEIRNCEVMLYKRCVEEGERILLQCNPPKVYHAIKMNIKLFRWERALEIVNKYGVFKDVLIWYRGRYLEGFGRRENDEKFKKLVREVGTVVEAEVREKKTVARDKERGGGGGDGGGRK